MRAFIFLILSLLAQTAFGQTAQWEIKANTIVANAKEQLGVGYKYGTSEPNVSFDCSGFVSYVYGESDINNSRSSGGYAVLGKPVLLTESRKGDCIIFAGTAPGSTTPGHIGIVISNVRDNLQFIHCSSSKKHFGVIITEYYSSSYPKRFLEVRRMF